MHTRIKQFKEKCLLAEQKSKAKLPIASGFVNYVLFYDGLEEWHLLVSDCFLSGETDECNSWATDKLLISLVLFVSSP